MNKQITNPLLKKETITIQFYKKVNNKRKIHLRSGLKVFQPI